MEESAGRERALARGTSAYFGVVGGDAEDSPKGARERALARGASAYLKPPGVDTDDAPTQTGRDRSLARGASAYFKFVGAEGGNEASPAVRERALARGESAAYLPPSAKPARSPVGALDEAAPLLESSALWIASCICTSLLGVFLGSLANAHASAHTKPDSSQLFRLRQEVAGALTSMVHFREAAAGWCAACGIGCLAAWSEKPALHLASLASLLGSTAYFILMAAAAHLTGDSAERRHCAMLAALFYGGAIWRYLAFLPKGAGSAVAATVALLAVCVGALSMRMHDRAGELEPLLERARQISHHVHAESGYAWPVGADAPVGFREASASKGGWWPF